MRPRRRDANHAEIVRAFESLHCSVIDVSQTPCGFDILVGYAEHCIPVEIKDGSKPPSARKLTPNEEKVHARWTGGKEIVTSIDDVLRVHVILRARAGRNRAS